VWVADADCRCRTKQLCCVKKFDAANITNRKMFLANITNRDPAEILLKNTADREFPQVLLNPTPWGKCPIQVPKQADV
jgi:hypothetical protein